jgi:hypothetical protein
MNGLKVYINSERATFEPSVFYSRREDGPYYRWRFEERQGRWHFARAHPSEVLPKALCVASWRDVPAALQVRLDEHYLE